MKLLLSGGGDPNDVVALDTLFSSQIDKQKPVLYVPIAWDDDPTNTYMCCLDWFKQTFQPYGITNIELCADLSNVGDMNKYTAVFIGGGNTYKLLKHIKESRFDVKLVEYLNSGGFVYGGSAGAIIFGSTINTAEYADANDVGLTDFSGLNLVGGKDILCHYSPKDDDFIKRYPNDLYILYEESGLFVTDGGVEVVGKPYINKCDITLFTQRCK